VSSPKLASFGDLPQAETIVFHHLPRCGGTHLADRIQHGARGRLPAFGWAVPPTPVELAYVESLGPRRLIHGHYLLGADRARGVAWPHFTVMRNPEQRFISEFFLQLAFVPEPLRPEPHVAFEQFVASLAFASHQVLLLATEAVDLPSSGAFLEPGFHPQVDDDVLHARALAHLSERFFAVGALERLEAFLQELGERLDVDIAPAKVFNARDRPEGFSVDNVPAARDRMRELLALDFRLYDQVLDGRPPLKRPATGAQVQAPKPYHVFDDVELGEDVHFGRDEQGGKGWLCQDRLVETAEGQVLERGAYCIVENLRTPLATAISFDIEPVIDVSRRFEGAMSAQVRDRWTETWRIQGEGRRTILAPPGTFASGEPVVLALNVVRSDWRDTRFVGFNDIVRRMRFQPLATLESGETQVFGLGRAENSYLLEGFGLETEGLVWSSSPSARLAAPMATSPARGAGPDVARVTLAFAPYLSPGVRDAQRVRLAVGGCIVAEGVFDGPGELAFFTDLERMLDVRLELPDAISGYEAGFDLDTRNQLAIGLRTLRVDRLPQLNPDVVAHFTTGSDFVLGMGEGWKPPEYHSTWSTQPAARLVLACAPSNRPAALSLRLGPLLGPGETEAVVGLAIANPRGDILFEGDLTLAGVEWRDIPLGVLGDDTPWLTLTFRCPTRSLADVGLGDSDFPLGFQLIEARLRAQ